jgi:hypothetical protein
VAAVLDRVRGGVDGTTERLRRRPAPEHVFLIVVSAAYCLLVFWRTSQQMSLTYDEVVYASQLSVDSPAAEFTAHRARGMPLLVAPVVAVTEWVFALRVYLTLLAGLSLYLAFRPWLAVTRRAGDRYRFIAPVAAASFASLWITILYGTMGYPNLWVAFALVAGVGYFARAVDRPSPGPIIGVVVAFTAASLIRPTDALAVAGPLLVAPLLVRAWRQLAPWLAVVAGLLGGWVPWVIEAYASFGGPVQRFRDGGESTGSGLVNALPANLDALDGPEVLCRPASDCAGVASIAALWWFALPVLAAAGLVIAARAGWLRYAALATVTAVAVAGPYLFLLDYAAPRFLLTTYGLLAIPVAGAIVWLVGLGPVQARVLTAALIAGGFMLHLVIQLDVLQTIREPLEDTSRRQSVQAEYLRDEHGIHAPCLVWGEGAVQLGYLLHCRSVWEQRGDAPSEQDPDIAAALARGDDVVVRIRADEVGDLPDRMAGWQQVTLPGDDDFVALLSPT